MLKSRSIKATVRKKVRFPYFNTPDGKHYQTYREAEITNPIFAKLQAYDILTGTRGKTSKGYLYRTSHYGWGWITLDHYEKNFYTQVSPMEYLKLISGPDHAWVTQFGMVNEDECIYLMDAYVHNIINYKDVMKIKEFKDALTAHHNAGYLGVYCIGPSDLYDS